MSRSASSGPVAPPEDPAIGWGSDAIAELLRRLELPFISLNPGASYRGLHDSLVNYLGNERAARCVLCLHEEHAVALAHGYAKVTDRPMAVALHSNVGLMHATMALFNAFCDRVPMLVLGATGPLDAARAAPVDRLDPHRRRPGRADPRLRQVGRPAGARSRRRSSRSCAPTRSPAATRAPRPTSASTPRCRRRRSSAPPRFPTPRATARRRPRRPTPDARRRARRRCALESAPPLILAGRVEPRRGVLGRRASRSPSASRRAC